MHFVAVYRIDEKSQSLVIRNNGQILAQLDFQNCDPIQKTIQIDASTVVVGWNQLQFESAYAMPPQSDEAQAATDTRNLSVAFTQLEIK